MSANLKVLEKTPAHYELYLDYMDRLDKGERTVSQREYAEKAGLAQSSLSSAFKRCRMYEMSMNAEERQQVLMSVNRNLLKSVHIGVKNRRLIIERADNNLGLDKEGKEQKIDHRLQDLSEGMVKDSLDRLPETSKEAAKVQIMNINANQTVVPNLLADEVDHTREGFGDMFDAEAEVVK